MYRTQRGVFSHQLDDISGSIELPLLRLRGDTELPEEILINPPDGCLRSSRKTESVNPAVGHHVLSTRIL